MKSRLNVSTFLQLLVEGDKMYPRGDEEGDLECKSAKAKRLLRE